MVHYTFLKVPPEKTLVAIVAQPVYRGCLILALDVRRQYLLVAQTMSGIKACIEDVVGQPISETSLYESARRQLRKGLTHGTWSVCKFECTEGIEKYNSIKHMYAKRIVAARASSQWQFK
jgi:uncharacterized protein YunC (DUF1805 family)